MKKNIFQKRMSLAVKTSFSIGTIILILLIVNSVISIKLQSDMSNLIINRFVSNQKKALDADSVRMKNTLMSGMTVNLEICTSITSGYIYDYEQEKLYRFLANYLKLDEIVAIKVLDVNENPFASAWKNPGIKTGESLPAVVKVDKGLSISADAVYDGKKVGSIRFYYNTDAVDKNIAAIKKQTQDNINGFKSIAKNNKTKAVTTQVIVAGVIIAIFIVSLLLCLQVCVSRPIKRTVDMIKDIAQGEGDLTRRLEVKTNDEIGELSRWFNRFVNQLQDLVKEVDQNAGLIGTASTEFSQLSASMNSSVDDLSVRTGLVSDGADEMSANISSVSAAMEETSTNINMVATASEEMSSTIDEIAGNAEKASTITGDAVSQTQNASDKINKLGQAADQIGEVVEIITDISEQVNLLALNATIEAARAGEAGKGFAVVANEIKDLARQTAEASGSIKEQIMSIQSSASGTVEEISGISKVVSEINNIVSSIAAAVEEQSVSTKEIVENIAQASTGVSDVNENVAQGSSGIQQVAREIAEIREASAGLASSSNEVNANAGRLSNMSDRLIELMKKFKV